MYPCSCDTLVALPPSTEGQRIIFGKNSDRPCDEVQEVLYFPAADYEPGSKVEVGSRAPVSTFLLCDKPCFFFFSVSLSLVSSVLTSR